MIKNDWVARASLLVIGDMIIAGMSMFFSLMLRFDFSYSAIGDVYIRNIMMYFPIHLTVTILIFFIFRLYHSLWRFASINEACHLVAAAAVLAVVQFAVMKFMNYDIPRSYFIVEPCIQLILSSGMRYSYRLGRFMKNNVPINKIKTHNVMIVGGGEAGKILLEEFEKSKDMDSKVCCIIDDNPQKCGKYINGIPIAGNREKIPYMVKKYRISDIIIAIPAADALQKKEILNICKETKCKVQILPGIYQLIKGEVKVSQLRPVEIEDLLGREPIRTKLDDIMEYVSGKVVLVTGGGGSIGSELCRQIAQHDPKQLIILDIYENNAYSIQIELKRNFPELDLITLIGSVRNTHRIESIFETYHPDIVYHAAAHKHVPLMEDSPNEAVKNNVFGTLNTALAAGKNGTKRFILISTDKAVNPTNMMGATKRICEMIIQAMNHRYPETTYAAVRFGNVLGSNGSVIPLFKKQISHGGPVTVTHPDIIRYFMTIPEAVSLVLQAGSYAKGGEIFVLDMGEPVKIADMARNLIKLSGYEPDVDIKIEYTGLRPGEKLFEELLMDEEGLKDTANHMIHIGQPIKFNESKFWELLTELKEIAYEDGNDIWYYVKNIVSTYQLSEDKKVFNHKTAV